MPGPKVSKAVSCRHDADPVLGDGLIAEDSRNGRLRRFFFPRVKQGDIEITLLVIEHTAKRWFRLCDVTKTVVDCNHSLRTIWSSLVLITQVLIRIRCLRFCIFCTR